MSQKYLFICAFDVNDYDLQYEYFVGTEEDIDKLRQRLGDTSEWDDVYPITYTDCGIMAHTFKSFTYYPLAGDGVRVLKKFEQKVEI